MRLKSIDTNLSPVSIRGGLTCQSWGKGLMINILESVRKGDCLFTWRGNHLCWSLGVGGGSTINMKRINSQHFTWIVNCQSSILGGGGAGWELCSSTISVQSRGLQLVSINGASVIIDRMCRPKGNVPDKATKETVTRILNETFKRQVADYFLVRWPEEENVARYDKHFLLTNDPSLSICLKYKCTNNHVSPTRTPRKRFQPVIRSVWPK